MPKRFGVNQNAMDNSKNPAAVALGRMGGKSKSEKKLAAINQNFATFNAQRKFKYQCGDRIVIMSWDQHLKIKKNPSLKSKKTGELFLFIEEMKEA